MDDPSASAAPRVLEVVSHGEEQTMRLAERFARVLRAGDVVSLEGELGAGKTCFVRGLARGLGVDSSRVHSPTFVLMNIYEPLAPGGVALAHLDAYRLRDEEDLGPLGFDRVRAAGHVIAIEWSSRIESALPGDRWIVSIEHRSEHERVLRFASPHGAPPLRLG